MLKEADVQVYAIGVFDKFVTRHEERMGPLRLDEVANVAGGRMIAVHDSADIQRAASEISLERRNQYLLGYRPTQRTRDGKWRRIKVQLKGTNPHSKFRLHARNGYYGPVQ